MQKGFWQGLYQKLASPKLTVGIFLVLAAASVVGTLLPQGLGEADLQRHYGQRAIWFITTFGLNDLYHAGWFRLLLLILCTNLIVCTIERLPKTMKIFRRRDEHVAPQKLAKCSLNCQFTSKLSRDETEARLTGIIAEGFGALQRLDGADHMAGVAEKGRWSPFMVYVVHLSVLLVLCGALVGSIFGFKGSMNILEGETVSEVMLEDTDRGLNLPFQVRCDKFDVSYYDNGMPREFRSDLTLIRDGKEVLKQELRVNDPLTYGGITFYQASYGAILKDAEVELTDRESGAVRRFVVPFREWVDIPGTRDSAQFPASGRLRSSLRVSLRSALQLHDMGSLLQRPAAPAAHNEPLLHLGGHPDPLEPGLRDQGLLCPLRDKRIFRLLPQTCDKVGAHLTAAPE